MRHRSPTVLALALSLAAASAAAQTTDVQVQAGGVGASGSAAAASVTSGASATPGSSAMTTTLSAPGLGSAAGASAAPSAAAILPSAPGGLRLQGTNGPATLPAASAPAGLVPGRAPALPTTHAAPFAPASTPGARTGTAANPAAAPRSTASGAARTSEVPTRAAAERDAASGPAVPGRDAGAALNGAARKLSAARLAEAAGGDGLSVARALDRVFDDEAAAPALRASGVAGRAQSVRDQIAQKVGIANTSSPADAPGLYQDAIKTARDALPATVAAGAAKVVRGFASAKADVSLGDLASAAFAAAASGAAPETGRLLSAFDKWETLLGVPGKPLLTNASALKDAVDGVLAKAAAGAAVSAPHVWLAKKDGAYTAVLPGAGVAAVPALAAAFALAPSALVPESALSGAYRAFAADPRAANGAGLIYRARRELGATVPAAALSAGRFWLRAALESLWRRIVALFRGAPTYDLSSTAGQEALRRDAVLSRAARDEAASTARLLSAPRLTVAGARAAFAAAGRAAASFDALENGGASAAISSLRGSFEAAASARSLSPADEVPTGVSDLIDGPGGLAHWAKLVSDRAWRREADAALRREGTGLVNLGEDGGPGAEAAALAGDLGAPAASVVLGENLWARGRGPYGEARLAADVRATAAGGSVELSVERGDPALARRLEDLGLAVFPAGAGLRAVLGPEDFSRGAGETGFLAARALAAALGGGAAPVADGAALRELAAEARRDPADAAALAARLDGREAFARAPVIGYVGEYEALAAASVSVDGRPLLVSALRDPDTGLLAYARAARPSGAPLGAAELRALLRAK